MLKASDRLAVLESDEKVLRALQPRGTSLVYPPELMPDGKELEIRSPDGKPINKAQLMQTLLGVVRGQYREREEKQNAEKVGEEGVPPSDSGRGDTPAGDAGGDDSRSQPPVQTRQESLQETLACRKEYLDDEIGAEQYRLQTIQSRLDGLYAEREEVEACINALQSVSRRTSGKSATGTGQTKRKSGSTRGGQTASKKKTTSRSKKKSSAKSAGSTDDG